MSAASLLHRWRQLGAEERRFTARAWLAAPVVELSLAALGLRRTLAWVEALPARRRRTSAFVEVGAGERLVRGAYAVHFVRGKCLPRSIVQYALHRRDGAAARLVIGVRRGRASGDPDADVAGLSAHAWVEAAGGPPRHADDFAPILVAGGGDA